MVAGEVASSVDQDEQTAMATNSSMEVSHESLAAQTEAILTSVSQTTCSVSKQLEDVITAAAPLVTEQTKLLNPGSAEGLVPQDPDDTVIASKVTCETTLQTPRMAYQILAYPKHLIEIFVTSTLPAQLVPPEVVSPGDKDDLEREKNETPQEEKEVRTTRCCIPLL